jgi:Zn-finger nucleic acid-binding protein
MQCLNCGTEMTTNEVTTKKDSISYDMCDKCGSLWLDAGDLDKMAFKTTGSIEYCEEIEKDEPEKKPKKCPRCDDFVLSKVKFLESDDIHLHYCRNCGGFWLDGGELKLIDDVLAEDIHEEDSPIVSEIEKALPSFAKLMPAQGHGFSDFVNNVHVPYWYKRIKRPSHETDFTMDVPPIKDAVQKEITSDVCPVCGQNLYIYSIFSMQFEGCAKCKGIWLIKDELRRLKNKVDDGSLRWLNDEIADMEKTSARPTTRPCVKCKTTKMVAVLFGKSSVIVDWCPRCHGIWLDKGEFEIIASYLKTELDGMHPREIEKQAAADVECIWSGGPESRLDELIDAKAAVSALINTTIFDHPALFKLCATAGSIHVG